MLNANREYYNLWKQSYEYPNSYMEKYKHNDKIVYNRYIADGYGYPFAFYPEENGLIPCCEFNGDFTIYWKTGSKWSIVAYSDLDIYAEYNMTLTEFIYKILTQDISFGELYNVMTRKGMCFVQYENS